MESRVVPAHESNYCSDFWWHSVTLAQVASPRLWAILCLGVPLKLLMSVHGGWRWGSEVIDWAKFEAAEQKPTPA